MAVDDKYKTATFALLGVVACLCCSLCSLSHSYSEGQLCNEDAKAKASGTASASGSGSSSSSSSSHASS